VVATKRELAQELQRLGVEITYTTPEVAKILGRTRQGVFQDFSQGRYFGKGGEPLELWFDGKKYIWTPDDVKYAAVSLYQAKKITFARLREIIRRILIDQGRLDGNY
jgi:hypothetical protein